MYYFYSDEKLLELLCASNDTCAFSELYHRHWKLLFCLAVKQLGSSAEAEEVVQDLFLDIWKRRKSLAIRSSLSTYLCAALNHKVINLLNKKKRMLQYVQSVRPDLWIERSSAYSLDVKILEKDLTLLVGKLPCKCRIVFTLSRSYGYSRKQIAQKLAISEKTVEAHISNAIRKLRAGLFYYSST